MRYRDNAEDLTISLPEYLKFAQSYAQRRNEFFSKILQDTRNVRPETIKELEAKMQTDE